jgi:SAM-dependent methyltransferase
MGREKQILSSLHQSTKRNYLERMNNSKVEAMIIAKKYSNEYWDGDRKFGYGGYKYIPGRWEPIARCLIDLYNLKDGSKILDIGCGKGFLLYEIQLIEPGIELYGLDISEYSLNNLHPDLNANTFNHRAQDRLPFTDNFFDLVISLGTLHNLCIYELESALKEIERVGKKGYIMVESFRNELELFNLECWALTIKSINDVDEWKWIFDRFGYTGDYEFIFFE